MSDAQNTISGPEAWTGFGCFVLIIRESKRVSHFAIRKSNCSLEKYSKSLLVFNHVNVLEQANDIPFLATTRLQEEIARTPGHPFLWGHQDMEESISAR
jgi:hypothetical protein